MKFAHAIRSAVLLLALPLQAPAQPAPIRIALIDPLSGPTASAGATVSKTLLYAVDLVNGRGGVLGRKLEVVAMDNGGDASKAVALLGSVVDQKIRFLVQAANSGIAASLLGAVRKHNERNVDSRVLFLNYGSALPELTGEQCSFWFFRFEADQRTKMRAVAEYVKGNPQIRKIYLVNQDYAFGREVSADAREIIGKARPDMQFVGDDFHPFGKVKDFGPYIQKIRQSGADTVLTGNWGNDLALLVRAGKDFGLVARYLTYYGGLYGMPTAVGPAAQDALFQIASWHPNVPVENAKPALEKYQQDFRKKYGEDLYYTSIVVETEMLARAIEKAGTADDPEKVSLALEGMEYDSPFGSVRMRREDHQAIHPLYIGQLVKGVKYEAEGLGMGWKTVHRTDGAAAASAATCRMTDRPH